MSYFDQKIEEDIQNFELHTLPVTTAAVPKNSDLTKAAMKSLTAWAAKLADGTFPDLSEGDCHVSWGTDTQGWSNIDASAETIAADGAGNYWLICVDGTVRSWSHDEGGVMEDHNEFDSIESFIECHVVATAVKSGNVTLESVVNRFDQHEDEGWEWMHENLEEYVEDM